MTTSMKNISSLTILAFVRFQEFLTGVDILTAGFLATIHLLQTNNDIIVSGVVNL